MAKNHKRTIRELQAKIAMLEHEISIIPSPITAEWLRHRNMVNTDIHICERKIENIRLNKPVLGHDLGEMCLPNPAMRKILRVA